MSQTIPVRNPFMLMISPEVVLAAVENSERLSQLNSRLCRPLDRPTLGAAKVEGETVEDDDADDRLLSEVDGPQS
jgi:hypothetical protein